eukprot:6373646-Pyramimonas_sp.AAC.1
MPRVLERHLGRESAHGGCIGRARHGHYALNKLTFHRQNLSAPPRFSWTLEKRCTRKRPLPTR